MSKSDCPECKGTGVYRGLQKEEPCSLCHPKKEDRIYPTNPMEEMNSLDYMALGVPWQAISARMSWKEI